jgi:hypothetical protein
MRSANMQKPTTAPARLPVRLPSGTRYVIEGRRSKTGHLRIVSRQVILPNGEHFEIAAPREKIASSARRKA